jgi:hypothetical protein
MLLFATVALLPGVSGADDDMPANVNSSFVGQGNSDSAVDSNDLDHSDVPLEENINQYWGSDNPSN